MTLKVKEDNEDLEVPVIEGDILERIKQILNKE